MLTKVLTIFCQLTTCYCFMPVQAVQWKYYLVKSNLLIQELFSIPYVSAEIFEPHGFLFDINRHNVFTYEIV